MLWPQDRRWLLYLLVVVSGSGRLLVHTTTVERHSPCSCKIVLLDTPLLYQLLCHSITGREKYRCRHTLGEQRACCQLRLVPAWCALAIEQAMTT